MFGLDQAIYTSSVDGALMWDHVKKDNTKGLCRPDDTTG
jgi:hypothetical protein